jgi:nucleotide-binding universal stress UspA family protein
MRVLCCLDGTNAEQVHRAVSRMLCAETTIGILYVTDTWPQEEMERHRERLLRPPHPPLLRREQMRQAEEASAQEILEEGKRYLVGAETLQRTGRPEREIVNSAAIWHADLIVICSRSTWGGGSSPGPKSVGHVARFVLDHAPCPVLLIRPLYRA